MQDTPGPAKRAVEIVLDANLADRAAAQGVDLARLPVRALEDELARSIARAQRNNDDGDQWRRENAEAIKSWNDELERNGLWSDGMRTF